MKITGSKKTIILGILIFVIFFISSAVGTFSALAYLNKEEVVASPLAGKDKTSKPTAGEEVCPLNGVKYSTEMRQTWEKRRPLGVMIENSTEARPIYGLSRADVVYEAVAEGGITRFMAVFLCQDAGELLPVRSIRMYFIDWLSEYGIRPLLSHVGGANTSSPTPQDALGFLRRQGWVNQNDLDYIGSIGFPTYVRQADRFAPHNVSSSTQKLWEAAAKRGFTEKDPDGKLWNETFSSWNFKDEVAQDKRPESAQVKVNFWNEDNDYTVEWNYDKTTNTYKRNQKGTEKDQLTDEEIAPKVVIVQFEKETQTGDNARLLYKTTGSGDAVIFQDGKFLKVTWKKADQTSKTRFFDSTGKEISFNRGQIWIEVVPTSAVVKY
jgi:hypothetical protein